MPMPVEVRYYTDPACPWSWGFEPMLRRLIWEFGDQLGFVWVMGGLARKYGPDYRDEEGGINVALFSPAALAARRPRLQVEWLCETRAQTVRFYSHEAQELRQFPLQQFVVDGALPTPAT